ncbi:hypothetical protein CL617_00035 [archaeon]|nr:hypothetical protein [archaeon]|tara:strand:+ start:5350 stop:5997 length:648 start_codon:yes stop_codon:yes gene_type:complete
MIKKAWLDHSGGVYIYRVHDEKLKGLCNNGLSPLSTFLENMFTKCPNEYFKGGPRSSTLKISLNGLDLKQISGHQMSILTKHALDINKERFKQNHEKVQMFMLENDNDTIAMEVPVWLMKDEIDSFKNFFKSDQPLTGHIDLLKIENGKVWIWDYKPNAIDEQHAATQIFMYALMINKRTGIPLEDIRCGYFDAKYAFLFKPELKMLNIKTILDY